MARGSLEVDRCLRSDVHCFDLAAALLVAHAHRAAHAGHGAAEADGGRALALVQEAACAGVRPVDAVRPAGALVYTCAIVDERGAMPQSYIGFPSYVGLLVVDAALDVTIDGS